MFTTKVANTLWILAAIHTFAFHDCGKPITCVSEKLGISTDEVKSIFEKLILKNYITRVTHATDFMLDREPENIYIHKLIADLGEQIEIEAADPMAWPYDCSPREMFATITLDDAINLGWCDDQAKVEQEEPECMRYWGTEEWEAKQMANKSISLKTRKFQVAVTRRIVERAKLRKLRTQQATEIMSHLEIKPPHHEYHMAEMAV